MTQTDRLCIIIFYDNANIHYKVVFMAEETKKIYLEKIEKIKVHCRTNILNGLTKVIEILKQDKKSENNNELMEEMRAEITMLLSDEYDNDFNTEEIVDEVKIIIKGKNLAFTLIFLVMEKIIILN